MYCTKKNIYQCLRSLQQQAELLLKSCNGLDITIKEHKNKRTLPQNDWLWAVYKNIVDFYNETGFFLDGIVLKFCNTDLVHEYCKCRYGIKTTTKLSTKEIGDYIETIQRDMIEQSNGIYEPIFPENAIDIQDEIAYNEMYGNRLKSNNDPNDSKQSLSVSRPSKGSPY